jgi:hypothetical protein
MNHYLAPPENARSQSATLLEPPQASTDGNACPKRLMMTEAALHGVVHCADAPIHSVLIVNPEPQNQDYNHAAPESIIIITNPVPEEKK